MAKIREILCPGTENSSCPNKDVPGDHRCLYFSPGKNISENRFSTNDAIGRWFEKHVMLQVDSAKVISPGYESPADQFFYYLKTENSSQDSNNSIFYGVNIGLY